MRVYLYPEELGRAHGGAFFVESRRDCSDLRRVQYFLGFDAYEGAEITFTSSMPINRHIFLALQKLSKANHKRMVPETAEGCQQRQKELQQMVKVYNDSRLQALL